MQTQRSTLQSLFFIWLAWVAIIIGFQTFVEARMEPRRPDYALTWTPSETARNSQRDKPYLMEPFMNRQVSWDSEFYLSIATVGYDDPDIRVVNIPGREGLSMNYAFFPFYPLLAGAVRVPLQLLGLSAIGTSTLAGVLVSLVGTFFGMLALYDLSRSHDDHQTAMRAVFYLLIFPSAFFLAQVYTEGLFIGLAFGALALMRRNRLAWAALLAAFATWTRAIGLALVLPLAITWLQEAQWWNTRTISRRQILRGLLILAPVGAYVLWYLALGEQFALVEEHWFGRGLFDFQRFFEGLKAATAGITDGGNNQMRAYFLLETASVLLATAACLFTLRWYPGPALFSLLALLVTVTSGAPQSLIRYVLVLPSIYLFLSRLGRNIAFDRAWTTLSLLLMGLLVTLFTFDMWVA